MTYAMINNSGNVLQWFDDERSARNALEVIVAVDPASAMHVNLLAFDEAGAARTVITSDEWASAQPMYWVQPSFAVVASGGDAIAQVSSGDIAVPPQNEARAVPRTPVPALARA